TEIYTLSLHDALPIYQGAQTAGALDVVDDVGARVARYHILGEQHHQAIREDQRALVGYHANPVAVAVEGQAQVGAFALHAGNQRSEEHTSELQSREKL